MMAFVCIRSALKKIGPAQSTGPKRAEAKSVQGILPYSTAPMLSYRLRVYWS